MAAAASEHPERFRYGPHPAQYADLYRPATQSAPGVVIVIHGGFWRDRYTASLGEPLCADLAARGNVAWNVEYRRVGGGGGWPATFEDVAAAIDLLAAVDKVELSQVTTIGHSAGGQLAVWAAARAHLPPGAPGSDPKVRVTAAISQAGVLNLVRAATNGVGGSAVPDLLGGRPDQVPTRYAAADPLTLQPGVPVRALHSRADEAVPFDQSSSYVDAARRTGGDAALIEVPGGHMELVTTDTPAWRATVHALAELTS